MKSVFARGWIIGAMAAAACIDASAQSSVSLSGTVRLAVAKGNGGSSPLYGSGGDKSWIVNDLVSNLNVSGKEDLGDGMYAGFALQHFFQADTGTPSNFSPSAFWDGQSLVKVGGRWGEVYLGHDYSPLFWTGLFVDPWMWDGSAAQMGILQWANFRNTAGIRTNNTVGYKTPAIDGFTAQIAVSAAEGAATGRDVGANVTYAAGPIWVSAAVDQHRNANGIDSDRVFLLAAAYDFGAVRPMASYATSRIAGVAYSSYTVALTAPIGNGVVKAGVAHLSDWDTSTAAKEGLTKVSLGYQHNLSKRTNLFGAAVSSKADTVTRTTAVEFGLSHSF